MKKKQEKTDYFPRNEDKDDNTFLIRNTASGKSVE